MSVAETNDAFEVTAELSGVDEKDITVSLDAKAGAYDFSEGVLLRAEGSTR